MTSKFFKLISIGLILVFVLSACGTTGPIVETPKDTAKLESEMEEKDVKIKELETKIEKIEANEDNVYQAPIPSSNNIIVTSMDVLDSIKNMDMNKLSSIVHPTDGVRFTPYEYVDLKNDKVFTAAEVVGLGTDTQIYSWGNYDGSGFPIEMDFNDYYDEFIYDVDFMNPNLIGNNLTIGKGNMVNNIGRKYPNAKFVEFHFTGIEAQYAGIDWRSLRLVFEDLEGTWYLVGIVHGEWTI